MQQFIYLVPYSVYYHNCLIILVLDCFISYTKPQRVIPLLPVCPLPSTCRRPPPRVCPTNPLVQVKNVCKYYVITGSTIIITVQLKGRKLPIKVLYLYSSFISLMQDDCKYMWHRIDCKDVIKLLHSFPGIFQCYSMTKTFLIFFKL